MAALGGRRGVAEIMGIQVRGFPAWVAWRLFYLGLLPGLATRIRVAADWLLDLLVRRSIAEIRRVQPRSREVRFRGGDLVIEPGIDPGGAYVVTSGRFRLSAGEGSANGVPLSRDVGPGGHFGASLNGVDGTADKWVRASEDSVAYFVAKDHMHRLATVSAVLAATGNATPPAGVAHRSGDEA